jgi:phosphoserine aminotransferase
VTDTEEMPMRTEMTRAQWVLGVLAVLGSIALAAGPGIAQEKPADNMRLVLEKIHADKNSLYNTPPCLSIYILRNVLAYNKSIGGLAAIHKNNLKKGELLYGCIDKYPEFYKGHVKVMASNGGGMKRYELTESGKAVLREERK